jgi:hypothetical protein
MPRRETYCDIHPMQVLHCPVCDGAKGGKKTAKLHSHKLSEWGKMGGRPRKRKKSKKQKR